ncbi:unnamed protein product [Penicillium bialowiezense]
MSPQISISNVSKTLDTTDTLDTIDTLDKTDPTLFQLEKRKIIELNEALQRARRVLQLQESFDASFWARATIIENASLGRSEHTRIISLKEHDDPHTPWEYTKAGKSLLMQIEAEDLTLRICEERVKSLNDKAPQKRSLRSLFVQHFTTSAMGFAITNTGAEKRNSKDQSSFRKKLIEVYDAKHPEEDFIWCPILGEWVNDKMAKASHIFPREHGQATMDAIFGEKRPSEMFSAKNGILMYLPLQAAFDKGIFVIIPDLPNKPSIFQMILWRLGYGREYRIKILDKEWAKIDRLIGPGLKTFRELDGERLSFSSPNNSNVTHRPAERYLYFHYCMAILQKTWQDRGQDKIPQATEMLQAESRRFFWGTGGRYLPRNMLLAFVEELGHDYEDLGHGYEDLLKGASNVDSNEKNLLLAVGAAHTKRVVAASLVDSDYEEDEDSESETSSEETDLSCEYHTRMVSLSLSLIPETGVTTYTLRLFLKP